MQIVIDGHDLQKEAFEDSLGRHKGLFEYQAQRTAGAVRVEVLLATCHRPVLAMRQ